MYIPKRACRLNTVVDDRPDDGSKLFDDVLLFPYIVCVCTSSNEQIQDVVKRQPVFIVLRL